MRYRTVDTNGYYFPTYFKTKREAVAYASTRPHLAIERKIGGNWFPCNK